jgi:hypothetical protein
MTLTQANFQERSPPEESMPIYIASSNPSLVNAVHRLVVQQRPYVAAIADCERVAPSVANGTLTGILFLDIASCKPSMAAILQTVTNDVLLLQRVAIVLIGDSNLLSPSEQQQIIALSLSVLPFPFADDDFVNLLTTLLLRFP